MRIIKVSLNKMENRILTIKKSISDISLHIDNLEKKSLDLKQSWNSPNSEIALSYLSEDISKLREAKRRMETDLLKCEKIFGNYKAVESENLNNSNSLPKNII